MNGQAIASAAVADGGPASPADPPGQARPNHVERVGADERQAAAAANGRVLRALRP